MEQLEKEFESMLVKTGNADLILKYTDLKVAIYQVLENANKALEVKKSDKILQILRSEMDNDQDAMDVYKLIKAEIE